MMKDEGLLEGKLQRENITDKRKEETFTWRKGRRDWE